MSPIDLLQPQTSFATTRAKLEDLRSLLTAHQLDAYLIPSADEHLNEYLPEAKQHRIWATGFTGSRGDLLLGRDLAWLFVDSRYYEQAELEVDPTLIQIVKVGLEGQKTLEETLEDLGREANQHGKEFRLGFDPFTLAVSQYREFQKQIEPCGVVLVPLRENLVETVRSLPLWSETEPFPGFANSKLFYLPETLTGETPEQKLDRVREAMEKKNVQILPVTKLDQIAWLFNLRGWDVPYNPVFIAYAIITRQQAFLFTNPERIEPAIQQRLRSCVTLLPYEAYADHLRSLLAQAVSCRVLLDPKRSTLGTYQILKDHPSRPKILEADSPIEGMKACKNAVELAQMQQANLKASRAKIRTLKWLSGQLAKGNSVTEADVAATVERFYAAEEGFQGLSFNTIAGAGANSSIVHYGTPNPQRYLSPGELLLLDSGAQYASGTTDDTRTVIIGEPTAEQIERYTEVLKAHINCAMQRFPKGTTGAQLDGITRATLWQAGLDYGHGTGHGVGAFLNVHEGPNGISKLVNKPLEPGMVTSIEPGFYEPGWGGIRVENLYVVKDLTEFQPEGSAPSKVIWYGFEPLTYIPFDQRLIDLNRLSDRQREWLQAYHQAVVEKLAPTLNETEAQWLQAACVLQ
ncbi:aminopeptidase P family protein [Leptothermofonsia sichuanensis E412]|uniref:aminopeptidase P family protein n=1 Tax=Leptothermofonsia sichuanensis TaxID=2917832 RepID=UPI001CA65810|nr:aminopeptidase P family protein [Leptothermofonsia sichuanensis]QZZ19576.1 aminopeptidase P family protein [Leptothermofonsia sichuanensis E412]